MRSSFAAINVLAEPLWLARPSSPRASDTRELSYCLSKKGHNNFIYLGLEFFVFLLQLLHTFHHLLDFCFLLLPTLVGGLAVLLKPVNIFRGIFHTFILAELLSPRLSLVESLLSLPKYSTCELQRDYHFSLSFFGSRLY